MKKLSAAILLFFCALMLSACGSIFEKEYVSVSEYVPPTQTESDSGDRVTVRNMMELKKAIIDMVYSGSEGGSIFFDPNYEGNAPEDMESACWQVRTQDALCVYCVRDLSYEIDKIVNYYESKLTIDYTSYAAELSSIIHLPYSVGLREILSSSMEENKKQLTILIDTSTTTADNVKALAQELYRKNPTICVREPQMTVYMYSGAGRQRLYEINFRYGMAEDEIIRCKSQLKNLDVISNLDASELDDIHRAYEACRYLTENCVYSPDAPGSCYDALILGESNSEGLALGYVEMCHQMDIDCRVIYGQLGGVDHCWNIIRLEGSFYHVDVSRCYDGRFEEGFLLGDEEMWSDHRWNIANYPACSGELTYTALFAPDETESGENTEEETNYLPVTEETAETEETAAPEENEGSPQAEQPGNGEESAETEQDPAAEEGPQSEQPEETEIP